MVNNINSVGFKINTDVLEFIMQYGLNFNLIIDPNLKHELENKQENKLTLTEKKNIRQFFK